MDSEANEPSGPQWIWEELPDGSMRITFPPFVLKNIAEDLDAWERIYKMWEAEREKWPNWKRSSTLREHRRESVCYGNCVGQAAAWFGRRQMVAWRKAQREKQVLEGKESK